MKRLSPEELADAITDFVNGSTDSKNKEFINALFRQHRTLQQSTIRLFLQTIEQAAEDDYRTDGRNEDTKKIAQDIVKAFNKLKSKEIQELTEGWKPSKFLGYI